MTLTERDPKCVDILQQVAKYLEDRWEQSLYFKNEHNASLGPWSVEFRRLKPWSYIWGLDIKGPISGMFVVKRKYHEGVDRYYDKVNRTPIVDAYLPSISLTTPTLIFFEMLTGLEDQALVDKLVQDEDLAQLYKQEVGDLMQDAGESGYAFFDVSFIDGKNCMLDPTTGKLKLIERTNLLPSSHFNPNELTTLQLLKELGNSAEHLRAFGEDNIVHIAFGLLRHFVAIYGKDGLYVRSERITPRNPRYGELYSLRRYPFGKAISEREYEAILAEHESGKDRSIHLYYRETHTRIVPPELIEAVSKEDVKNFIELLRKGVIQDIITDTKDQRFAPVVLPDADFFHPVFYYINYI